MAHYDWLLRKLDAFIRKYYLNQLMRGGLVLLSCALAYVLAASLGEYFLYLPVPAKLTVVGLFSAGAAAALIFWVIRPLAGMARLGKTLSHDQAASIVGQHFPEISDKLLNVLQLKRGVGASESRTLLEASIDQKAAQISVVPITRAIDLRKNRRYLRFLLPVLGVGVFILFAAPNVFRQGSARLLQPTTVFEKPAPFRFVIRSGALGVVRGGDYLLKVEAVGSALPAQMEVEIGGERTPMTAEKGLFLYTFKGVNEAVSFRLHAAGYSSGPYTLRVAQKPVMKAFKVTIDYPDYTGRKDETRASLSDLTVPVGTRLTWAFLAEHTDAATLQLGNGPSVQMPRTAMFFGAGYRFLQDTSYTITLTNRQTPAPQSYAYRVQVVPDAHPTVQLSERKDEISGTQILLVGTAGDDYGLTRLLFHYNVTDADGRVVQSRSVPLPKAGGALAPFQHYFDVQALGVQPGQRLTYYVEAWDNDAVHGSKSGRSSVMTYSAFANRQLDSAMDKNAQAIANSLSSGAKQTEQVQSEVKELQSAMLQSESNEWENKAALQDLAERQQDLKAKLEEVRKRFEEQRRQSEQKPYSEDLREAQEDLKKQMDNLIDKELQEQMQKLAELMQKLNKEQAMQALQQMEQDNKLFNMDLKRMQELIKKLEAQMALEDLAGKMDDLAAKQSELRKETDAGKQEAAALQKEQDALQKELQKAMNEDLKQADKAARETGAPDLNEAKQEGQQAGQNMQQSSEQLGQNNKSNSSKNQSKAAQNLQNMAASLRSAASGANMEQIKLDIRATRQILTNLMRLSFDQETLMDKVKGTPASSPSYLTNAREQQRLQGASRVIRDSLYTLSRRASKLAATVNKESAELERNMGAALAALENRRVPEAGTRQQYVMTHTNNLALMLNELLSNLLQMQSQAMQQGAKGSCSKPGGSGAPKPGASGQLSDIITQQQSLGNAAQQAQNASKGKNGQKPGEGEKGEGQGSKPGEGGAPGSGGGEGGQNSEYGSAEQLARMAAQQAAVRRQLNQLASLLNSKGAPGLSKELREIAEKMDRNETELVNRRFTPDVLMRHREILTRLLQAEQALREQEQGNERAARAGESTPRPIPAELQRYLQDRRSLLDLYRTVPPGLKPYYRSMVEDYYRVIGAGQ